MGIDVQSHRQKIQAEDTDLLGGELFFLNHK